MPLSFNIPCIPLEYETLLQPCNDWPIKRCLILCGSILSAILLLIVLSIFNIEIPFLRQLLGLIFLTFIPGLLLLRILRIHNLNPIESLVYSVGLSLVSIMAIGILINFILPPLGIADPLTLWPAIIAVVIITAALALVAYFRDKDYKPDIEDAIESQTPKGDLWSILNPYLLASLLPLLAVLATSVLNVHDNNALIYVLIVLVAFIMGLAAFGKFITPRVYPYTLFMMALALQYQTTLLSSNLVGADIHLEYGLGQLVLTDGLWNPALPFTINSCLSIVILAPIYSLISNMTIVWMFKAVYPILFSFLPLALFRIFRIQMGPRLAFLATVFFITTPMFFMDMPQLARQQVAELFFGLVILLMVERKLSPLIKTALIIIFGFGIVVSHYGLGTGYIGYLVVGSSILLILRSRACRAAWQWLIGKGNRLPSDLRAREGLNIKALTIIVATSLAFMVIYYGSVASGSPSSVFYVFNLLANLSTNFLMHSSVTAPAATAPAVSSGLIQDLLARISVFNPLTTEPLTRTALGLDFMQASIGGKIWRIFQYLVELCIILGTLRLIFRPITISPGLKTEYMALTITSILILLSVFMLPVYGWGMGSVRIWQITLMLMSPLVIVGGESIASGIVKFAGLFRKNEPSLKLALTNSRLVRLPFIAIFIPYFIFNSGAIFELSKSQIPEFIDIPYSVALSNHRLALSTSYSSADTAAADWIFSVNDKDYIFLADYMGSKFVTHYPLSVQDGRVFILYQFTNTVPIYFNNELAYPNSKSKDTPMVSNNTSPDNRSPFPSYIFLGTWNTRSGLLVAGTQNGGRIYHKIADVPGLASLIDNGNLIYNNNSARIIFNP